VSDIGWCPTRDPAAGFGLTGAEGTLATTGLGRDTYGGGGSTAEAPAPGPRAAAAITGAPSGRAAVPDRPAGLAGP